jgi:hypothetical protein
MIYAVQPWQLAGLIISTSKPPATSAPLVVELAAPAGSWCPAGPCPRRRMPVLRPGEEQEDQRCSRGRPGDSGPGRAHTPVPAGSGHAPMGTPDGKPVTRERLFTTPDGRALNRNAFNRVWRNTWRAAGIDPARGRLNACHVLRHTAALGLAIGRAQPGQGRRLPRRYERDRARALRPLHARRRPGAGHNECVFHAPVRGRRNWLMCNRCATGVAMTLSFSRSERFPVSPG